VAARLALGEAGLTAAWDAGQGMTLAEAVACATSDEVHDGDSQYPSSACPHGQGERDAEGGGSSDLTGDV
jgi:hypothetical protein